MPFISVKVIRSTASVPFIQFTAGQDQNVLCAVIVQLQANIIQGDLDSHSFEWEQIEGTPVALNDADTLSPWFINPNTTDLIFRFWIDRGTPFEKFSDVNIFRELASSATGSITISGNASSQAVLELGRTSSEVRVPHSIMIVPTSYSDQTNTLISNVCKTGPFMIMWEQPTGRSIYNILLGVEIQKLVNGDWVIDGVQVPERRYWNIENGVTYRLVPIWQDLLRNVVSKETSNILYRSPVNEKPRRSAVTVSAMPGLSIAGQTQLTSFSTFIPSLISKSVEANANASIVTAGLSQLTSFSTFIPGLAALPEPATSATPAPSIAGASNDLTVYVFRVSGISIGSPGD